MFFFLKINDFKRAKSKGAKRAKESKHIELESDRHFIEMDHA